MKEFQAREVRTKKLVPIPLVAILVFGFSCKDRSFQNPKASSKLGCIQEATGSTGTGWQDTKGVIVRHRPRKLYAENTRMLDTHTPDHEFYSDSAFIKKDCEDMGTTPKFSSCDRKYMAHSVCDADGYSMHRRVTIDASRERCTSSVCCTRCRCPCSITVPTRSTTLP